MLRRVRTRTRAGRGRMRTPQASYLPVTANQGAGDMAREAVDLELQNAIQLNDLLMIQDMVQVSSILQ